jgi:hypothetical protein
MPMSYWRKRMTKRILIHNYPSNDLLEPYKGEWMNDVSNNDGYHSVMIEGLELMVDMVDIIGAYNDQKTISKSSWVDGLPPEGVECLAYDTKVKVWAIDKGVAICEHLEPTSGNPRYDGYSIAALKPLDTRTAEEKAIDEILVFMPDESIEMSRTDLEICIAGNILAAIQGGDIPGVDWVGDE